MSWQHKFTAQVLTAIALLTAAPAGAREAHVERIAPDRVEVTWDGGAIDLFRIDGPGASLDAVAPLSSDDRDGHEAVTVASGSHPLFALRDRKTGTVMHVAERVVPLEQASNFRDIGGYPAADGKLVRWGLIYRSGATPLLTEADRKSVGTLGLVNMIDLRSNEERQIAPSRIDGVRYNAVGYSMIAMMRAKTPAADQMTALYRGMPEFLAPQLRLVFDLLDRDEGPLAFNCSAGQDRTGFTAAMVLSALGTPRDVIVKDYLMSTELRRPQFEMPAFGPEAFPGNPVARFFAGYNGSKPTPLIGADGAPYLDTALAEIERRWGSIDRYLEQEVGVGPERMARLRLRYTE
jgi:protein-tyrosine phosphatase